MQGSVAHFHGYRDLVVEHILDALDRSGQASVTLVAVTRDDVLLSAPTFVFHRAIA